MTLYNDLNRLVILSLNHKIHPIPRIERAFIKNIIDFVDKILKIDSIQGIIILQTCNRVEIYLDIENITDIPKVINVWESVTKDNNIHIDIVKYRGYEAIEHLFRLVTGLESMALGENEILHQAKEAYRHSCKMGVVSSLLRYLFEESFKISKVIRNKTYLGHKRISLADIGVEYAEEYVHDLNDKVIVVVGAGEVGTRVIDSLTRKKDRRLTIIIANRTYERAISLATRIGGIALHLDELDEYLKIADIVFVTTKAPHFIITKERIENVFKDRSKPMLIIDLSMPTNVEPSVKDIESIKLVSIEELKDISKKLDAERRNILLAEKYVQEYSWRLYLKLSSKWIEDIIKNIYKYAEKVRNEEVEEAIKTLGKECVNDKVIKVLDSMTVSLVKKILHPYSELLRRSYLTKFLKETSSN